MRFVLPLFAVAACSGSGLSAHLETGAGGARELPCGQASAQPEGEFVDWEQTVEASRGECSIVEHAIAGPVGATLMARIEGMQGTVLVEQVDWNGVVQDAFEADASEPIWLTVPFTGEHLLRLLPLSEDDAGGDYHVTLGCTDGCYTPYSRYPVLLMHGMGSPAGGDTTPYADVEEVLSEAGYQAWAPAVAPWNDSLTRGDMWREHLDAWREDGTWRKVHLMGHSMGGIDARYVASELDPNHQIATVTTLATPHRGSPVADLMTGAITLPGAEGLLEGLADWLSAKGASPGDPEVAEQMMQLSTAGMESFNSVVFDREDVTYRSWVGLTCGLTELGCQFALDWEIVSAELIPTYGILELGGIPHDGLVDAQSALWGEFQGFLAADHGDIGGRPNTDPSFYWEAFYLNEAARLAAWERGEDGPSEPQSYDESVLPAVW